MEAEVNQKNGQLSQANKVSSLCCTYYMSSRFLAKKKNSFLLLVVKKIKKTKEIMLHPFFLISPQYKLHWFWCPSSEDLVS